MEILHLSPYRLRFRFNAKTAGPLQKEALRVGEPQWHWPPGEEGAAANARDLQLAGMFYPA
ncbi:hypothetical protein, partial [Mesorhizobium sp. M4A.F.Ca.ET.020.02.1.1]|uniref:hypothetical protein n=1 Tax=Mesorhizobium sp. M4A.F.Ca.ET.020.02.1.1 TaxID=2496652 RepID=UPI001AECDE52